jgi:putative transposase
MSFRTQRSQDRTSSVTAAAARRRRNYRGFVPRRPRSSLPDRGIYQVTVRGVNRGPIVFDDVDRNSLHALVLQIERRFDWCYDAYCLMTTHFHLVLPTTLASLSAGMHRLNGLWAQRINRRYNRTGHLFENRFSAWVVRDEDHWRETCRYVLENPVKAGLCKSVHDWPWSGGRFLRDYRA